MISKIDDVTFEDQDSLETLDISLNGIVNLPPLIFHLPNLRNLYISKNLNINLAETFEKARPIKSPLQRLDISQNELEALPDLGIVPTLVEYNISGNGEMLIRARDFAGLCNLRILDNNNVTGIFDSPCECWRVEKWLVARKVQFSSFLCEYEQKREKLPFF